MFYSFNFDKIPEKTKTLLRNSDNVAFLEDIRISMLRYKSTEKSLDFRLLEKFLCELGAVAFWKYEGKLVFTPVQLAGEPDVYGLGVDALCTTLNGKHVTFSNWKENKDIVVLFNTTLGREDWILFRIANLMATVEKSLGNAVINSRYNPIAVVKNEPTRKAVKEALENGNEGTPQTIIGKTVFDDEEGEAVSVLNITDVKNSDKIQYLAHFRDDLLRWFFEMYGLTAKGSAKMAQQTEAEINEGSSASMALPYDMLYNRLLAVAEIKAKFGVEIAVEFSECWRVEHEEVDAMNGDSTTGQSDEDESEGNDNE